MIAQTYPVTGLSDRFINSFKELESLPNGSVNESQIQSFKIKTKNFPMQTCHFFKVIHILSFKFNALSNLSQKITFPGKQSEYLSTVALIYSCSPMNSKSLSCLSAPGCKLVQTHLFTPLQISKLLYTKVYLLLLRAPKIFS